MESGQHRLLELYREEKAHLLAYAQRQMRGLSSLDPEDVVAEILYKLLDRGDLVAQTENLVAYLYRAVANRILDSRRREGRAARAGDVDVNLLPDLEADPHAAFQESQLKARLTQAVDSLNPEERAVWLATEEEGQSFRALADLWGVPMGTLLSRKSRATAKLRQHLADLRQDRNGTR